ncbi:SDR family NAD(P)-dependent oxidoreductase [Alphaproteobacteria bacterium]|jgi:NAD(P)-dependent dehydrogenase (short-subunit alcohol dehydrogenase family)|nr:SDR family NAD(P)-dependent oxidoreductase [Alphaproteobacteria bacterium]
MVARLKDKIALVSGAGSVGPGWGNGKATAVLYAREGAKVFCADINLAAAEETRDIIRSEGFDAESIQCDVSKSDLVLAMTNACKDAYGRIDILHNNVGILKIGGPVDLSEEDWDRVNNVNLKSMFLTCKHVLPIMEAQGKGAIVNISSIAGIRWLGVPYLAYNTTKAAVSHFTRMVAVEYAGRGIRANAILPGLLETPMVEKSLAEFYADGDIEEMFRKRGELTPIGHGGDAWDVAYAAVYLASDEAKYVTGAELVVDGGLTLKSA